MECNQCGVCCTEISISSAIPGHPYGKPAGIKCVQLANNYHCMLFGKPERPAVCSSFQADQSICGTNAKEATQLIRWYEYVTSPN